MRPAIFVSAFTLAACASSVPAPLQPLQPLEIATAPYDGIATTKLSGSLMYEGGCLLFRDDGQHLRLFPIWPDGSTVNGTSVIFHEPGKDDQRIVVGEEFLMAGRPVQWRQIPNARIVLHRERCGGPPFAVLDIRPAN